LKTTRQSLHRNVIGARVRQARQQARPRMSQDDLAGRLAARGIVLDQTAVSRIENLTRYVMDYEALALARCLKVSIGWLYGEKH
jgi:ribosome-binding protein aMBF1 (putative translation factor)